MIGFMRFAIERAAERDMWVILYDEGMYPSGSSSGQVVAENPAFRTRGLVCVDLDEAKPETEVQGVRIGGDGEPELAPGQNLVAIVRRKKNGHRIAVIDRAAREGRSVIRGLHFTQDDPPRRADHREVPENQPPGADILNPESVACFIRLVYQRYYDEFGKHFGKTVKAIFTDEPSLLARGAERGMVPGTTGILEHVNAFLGYDFTEHLPALWYEDEPDAAMHRRDYNRALEARLEQTFYRPISEWCQAHGVSLTRPSGGRRRHRPAALFPDPGPGHRLAVRRAGQALRPRRRAIHAGQVRLVGDDPPGPPPQSERVLRGLRSQLHLRGDEVAGELAARSRLQSARAARVLLLDSRPAHRRASAGRRAQQHLVARSSSRSPRRPRGCAGSTPTARTSASWRSWA